MKPLEDVTPVDRNLYYNRHNYYVLVNYRNKKIYKIKSEDYNKYKLFKSRYIIALVLCILIYSYVDLKIVIASFFAVSLLLEILYRSYFLGNLDIIENRELPEKISQLDIILAGSTDAIRKRLLASVLLFIMICLSVFYFLFISPRQNLGTFEKIAVIVLAVAFIIYIIYLGVINFKALKIREKEFNEKKGKK